MSQVTLSDVVEAASRKFTIPGVAVGVFADGQEIYLGGGRRLKWRVYKLDMG
jgi:hypothetical protein